MTITCFIGRSTHGDELGSGRRAFVCPRGLLRELPMTHAGLGCVAAGKYALSANSCGRRPKREVFPLATLADLFAGSWYPARDFPSTDLFRTQVASYAASEWFSELPAMILGEACQLHDEGRFAMVLSLAISRFLISSFREKTEHPCLQRTPEWLRRVTIVVLLGSAVVAASAQKVASTTTLAVTSGTSVVSSVASGSPVTLTATVRAGALALTPGQVNFCDGSAAFCTDIHLLGTAQLTSGGKAVLKFLAAAGNHSYKAVFLGTNAYAGSSS